MSSRRADTRGAGFVRRHAVALGGLLLSVAAVAAWIALGRRAREMSTGRPAEDGRNETMSISSRATTTPEVLVPPSQRAADPSVRLRARTWRYVLARTVREFSVHQCTDSAAGLTYYAVLSLFPALIALFSLLGVFGQSGAAAGVILNIIQQVAPGETADALRGPIEQFAHAPGAGFALVFGILVALWSASGYVGAFSRVMNRMYEVPEGRPFWRLRPMQLVVTIVTVVALAVVAFGLILSGRVVDAVGGVIRASDGVRLTWSILKWPVLLVVVVLLVTVLYRATPNVKRPGARWISLGSVLAIVVLAAGTLLFGIYVSNLSNYARTYGSFASVIVFLLWLWIANLALLFGAELDAELERGRQLQAGIAAEEHIRLPIRDSRQSDKSKMKQQKEVAQARHIRSTDAGAAMD